MRGEILSHRATSAVVKTSRDGRVPRRADDGIAILDRCCVDIVQDLPLDTVSEEGAARRTSCLREENHRKGAAKKGKTASHIHTIGEIAKETRSSR